MTCGLSDFCTESFRGSVGILHTFTVSVEIGKPVGFGLGDGGDGVGLGKIAGIGCRDGEATTVCMYAWASFSEHSTRVILLVRFERKM